MITIFTPIYNRAYIVENLYHSLLRQTSMEFEWLIVDDGSTDQIRSLVETWIQNTWQFKIRFYCQENRGKHAAINYGVKLAKYDAFFIVDSDDYLEDDAVETITRYWKGISEDSMFAGISGLRRNKRGEVIGDMPVFEEYVDALNLEREKYGLEGDKAEVYKTEILSRFPFPEYEGERFLTEAVVWDKIAYEGYQIRWLNKSFVVCNYLVDGLTAKGEQLFITNPRGWAHHIRTDALYRKMEEDTYLKKCYYFYECECTRFTDDEIKGLLKLSVKEFKIIKEQYECFKQNIIRICNNKKVCIYGYGKWGKRLKQCMDCLQVKIEYVIDRKHKEIKEFLAYSIEMKLPETDIIFIALSKDTEDVEKAIRMKMPEVNVVLCKDIVPALW